MSREELDSALNIGLFGPPGSGKGTQAASLIDQFGFVPLAPGDLLRKEIREKTPLGQAAEAVMAAGQLVSDGIVNEMVGGTMAAVLERGGRILLDGFPRTLAQLEFLEDFLGRRASRLHGVFSLDIPNERLIERLTGRRICETCAALYHVQSLPPRQEGICDACGGRLVQRKDDNRESIQERLAAYERQTEPVLRALEGEGKLIRIPADRPREAIYGEIAERVQALLETPAPNRRS